MMRIIRHSGDVIMAAVVIVFGLAMLAGSGVAAEAPVEASATSTVYRDHGPALDAPYWAVKVAEDMDGENVDPLTEVGAPVDIERQAFHALLETGARGAMNDDYAAIYVKVGTVVDFGDGTITITNFGPGICVDANGEPVDGEPVPCTGREFLTAEWQSY